MRSNDSILSGREYAKALPIAFAPEVPRDDRWTIFLLSCRQPQTDFRFPLARELALLGHEVRYVFVKRRPRVEVMASAEEPREMSMLDFVRHVRTVSNRSEKVLIFNSTNLAFPGLSTFLRIFTRGLWCMDIHDDLLYEQAGWARCRAQGSQKLLDLISDLSVHAAPSLRELFPKSRHLGNASDMVRLERSAFDANNILILASLDGRLDFEFLREVVARNGDKRFHIHGQISKSNAQTEGKLQLLLADTPNLTYHGPYSNKDLPELLSRYSVTLAPYIVNARLTRYIDPLRFYHCLNSGMQVISTDIPAARNLQDKVAIITTPEAFAPLVEQLAHDPAQRRNDGSTSDVFNWHNRAAALMAIVEEVVPALSARAS